jgi:predicted DNA-binding transcriptional regulator YafY
MNFEVGLTILRLLSTRRGSALSAKEIHDQWPGNEKRPAERSVYRYLDELSTLLAGGTYLVSKKKRDGKENVFYLEPSPKDDWFLTEEMALDLSLGGQVLDSIFRTSLDSQGRSWAKRAKDFLDTASGETRRIRTKLRIVPDGIGRLPARIEPEVLRQTITAIRKDKKVGFVYTNAKGDKKSKVLTPLGLVAKDGTIYLVAVDGATGRPIHYALHRMSEASVHDDMSQLRPDFDLDRYIWDTHQFSHVLSGSDQLVSLELRVAPEMIYHFRERPLSEDQRVTEPMASDGWYRVDAKVPDTILLVPFLLSMGHWIEVLGPKKVRDETALRARQMWQHYQAG